MNLKDLKVGDKVTVYGYNGIDGFATVTKIDKVKVTAEFIANEHYINYTRAYNINHGYEWGGTRYRGSHIVPYEYEHENRIWEQEQHKATQHLANKISQTTWRWVSLKALKQISAILEEDAKNNE